MVKSKKQIAEELHDDTLFVESDEEVFGREEDNDDFDSLFEEMEEEEDCQEDFDNDLDSLFDDEEIQEEEDCQDDFEGEDNDNEKIQEEEDGQDFEGEDDDLDSFVDEIEEEEDDEEEKEESASEVRKVGTKARKRSHREMEASDNCCPENGQGFSSDTVVRTSLGNKLIAQLQHGDVLYDEFDRQVRCLNTSEVTGKLKEIFYRNLEFENEISSFKCSPDQKFALVAYDINPQFVGEDKKVIRWYTRCCREYHPSTICDPLLTKVCGEIGNEIILERNNRHPVVDCRNHVEDIVDQHFLKNKNNGINFDDYKKSLEKRGVTASHEFIRESIVVGVERFLREMSGSTSSNIILSKKHKHKTVTESDKSTVSDQVDSQSDSIYTPSRRELDSFTVIRKSLENKCDCKGIRSVIRKFKSEEHAQLVYSFLESDSYYLLDPFMVTDLDRINMTVSEFETSVCDGKSHLRIFRPPIWSPPTGTLSTIDQLPLHGYYLGLYLGDGCIKMAGTISNSSKEIIKWLKNYTAHLNSVRPTLREILHFKPKLKVKAGTPVGRTGFYRNVDVYNCTFASYYTTNVKYYNPILQGLKSFGLEDSKVGGIPAAYMQSDIMTRLAVIAGLIDSDGSYNKRNNNYVFSQMQEGHRKIVEDLRDLAISCGISVSRIHERLRPRNELYKDPSGSPVPVYTIRLTRNCELIQRYLQIPKKKMRKRQSLFFKDDVYNEIIKIQDAEESEITHIELESGHTFQKVDRLVLHHSM